MASVALQLVKVIAPTLNLGWIWGERRDDACLTGIACAEV